MPDAKDELTGLLTVQAFVNRLQETPPDGALILALMDLDRFKSLNDRYGHVAGDEWIKIMAGRFAETFGGEGSLIGRLGGDEFIAALPTPDLLAVYERAEALRASIEKDSPALTVSGETVHPGNTISLGLAAYPANAGDMNELVEKVKEALYQAKVAGGNRVCFYQETDTLTGLLNAVASQRSLEEALLAARQKKDALSVFVMDIDFFNQINEEYGHRTGDEVLKRLGHILENNFKDVGITGRVAGDQFMVILPGQRADSAFILAEEVRRLVEDSQVTVRLGSAGGETRSYTVRMRISGGIASFPSDATERVDLLRKADEALYRAKQTGRNRICLPTSAQMVTKTSYYTQTQLERLATLARQLDKTEAFLLREALDDLLNKYKDRQGGD
jgi:diguanylate cyclase (GGDEF)-like protein